MKEAEELRDLGTRGNREGGLEKAVCKTLLSAQNSRPLAVIYAMA